MSASPLRKPMTPSLAAFGLSLAALTAAFNVSAAGDEPSAPIDPAVAKVAPAQSNPANPDQAQLDQKLIAALSETGNTVYARIKTDYYDPLKDQDLQGRIDGIKALLKSGANPNHYVRNTLTIQDEAVNASSIGAAILIAAKARRPDLVQAFIDHGADVRLRNDRGWGAMDYAIVTVLQAQKNPKTYVPALSEVENAIRIVKILNSAGLRPGDATMLTNNSATRIKNYATLAAVSKTEPLMKVNNYVLQHILHDHGLLSDAEFQEDIQGDRRNAASLLNGRGITDDAIKENGGDAIDGNYDIVPGGSKKLRVLEGSTILKMAQNFAGMMGAANAQEAIDLIAARNHMTLTMEDASRPLTEEKELLVPIAPANLFGFTETAEKESVRDIAIRVKDSYYKKNASVDEIALEIARMNGVNADALDNKQVFEAGSEIIIIFANDTYAHLSPMTPPPNAPADRKVDLVLAESNLSANAVADGVSHARETFSVATSAAYGINHQVDMTRFHRLNESLTYFPGGEAAKGASNALKILMNTAGTPLQGHLVFSVSEAQSTSWENANKMLSTMTADNVAYEGMRLIAPGLEKSRPVIFLGAGNARSIEGPVIQSHAAVHSPHSTLMGAVGRYMVTPATGEMATVIAPYTSYGADACSRLPVQMKIQREGSSLIAPDVAALSRQFNEWYGDRLSFEEIKAAAMMSADRDLLDADDPKSMEKIILTRGGKPNQEKIKTHTATFNSNGGGLPHNWYCGAGVINPVQWKKNLDTLLTLKRPGQDAEGASITVAAGKPEISPVGAGGKQEYTYKLRVPQDMTLGRLTFLLPQDRQNRGEVVVKTPAGFEMQMPHSLTSVVSTDAFSYEDVHAGDIIEIRTNYPLGETAGLILRGQAPGNAIALLRDKLRADGTLPAPLKEMEGNRVVGPSRPVTVLRDEKVTWPGLSPN